MKRVTKLRSRKSCKTRAQTFFKKLLHPIFRTFLQKFPYIIEGIRIKLEAGICFVNLYLACTILNSTIQNASDRVLYKTKTIFSIFNNVIHNKFYYIVYYNTLYCRIFVIYLKLMQRFIPSTQTKNGPKYTLQINNSVLYIILMAKSCKLR